jgi:hypothetical protein
MRERFITAFEDVLAKNRDGDVRNLLITDDNPEFLSDALYELRSWAWRKHINLLEIDEADDSWLSEIQSRELFEKLNQPNTILLIKNYSTVSWASTVDNTPRNFLRDAVMNRHYGCGNDFVPSDELTNLLFVVALNDLSLMHWREEAYSLFSIMHEDDTQGLWVNTHYSHFATKMHPVMSRLNKVVYWVSDDKRTLCFDVGDAFGGRRLRRPIRYYSAEERTEMIHNYLENNLPPFCDTVDTLILKMGRFDNKEHFVLDDEKLLKYFPNLGTVCCNDVFDLTHGEKNIYILDAFDLGEMCFNLARDGDFEMANHFTRELWALDHKWARFFREVAVDYQLSRDYHINYYSDVSIGNTGLDKLFRIYLFGWYFESGCLGSFNDENSVYVKKHQNYDKAIELLATRFKKWETRDISEKLNWDLSHCAHDEDFKYEMFAKVIMETERLFSGTLDQLQNDGMEEDEVIRLRSLMADESKE